jgi:hypothetical protein
MIYNNHPRLSVWKEDPGCHYPGSRWIWKKVAAQAIEQDVVERFVWVINWFEAKYENATRVRLVCMHHARKDLRSELGIEICACVGLGDSIVDG